MFIYSAKVIKVVDGDTIDVEIDLGFKIKWNARLRLFGINAPETKGPSHEAGINTKRYVESVLPVGSIIVVKTFVDKSEKYGRYLASVLYKTGTINCDEILANPTILNDELVSKGLAVAYMGE
jgi:micrococcal nuclease